jgi:hypothetical protein
MSTVDLPTRLAHYGGSIALHRVALTRALIEAHDLPTFAAEDKRTDSRYQWFIENHGRACCELDALTPPTLRTEVEAAIRRCIEWDSWERCGLAEAAETESLQHVLDRWNGSH